MSALTVIKDGQGRHKIQEEMEARKPRIYFVRDVAFFYNVVDIENEINLWLVFQTRSDVCWDMEKLIR